MEDSMTDTPAYISLEHVEEHEDGAATYKLHMDHRAQAMVIEEGMKFLLHCAACKLDIADVYDWMMAQMPQEEGEPEEADNVHSRV
jgi:hypothetical protein